MKLKSVTLKPVFSASSLLDLSTGNGLLKRIITIFLRFLEKRLKGDLLLEAPESLQKIKSDLWPAIIASAKIKSLGAIVSKKRSFLPDEPFVYQYWTKINGQLSGNGSDFLSEKSALWRSIAEGVERYLWKTSEDFYQKKILFSNYANLKEKALNIFLLAGFSEKDKEKNEILSFGENSRFGWTEALSLLSEKKIYCPIQLVSHHYFRLKSKEPENPRGEEPMLRWPVSTGLATGRYLEEAVAKGILEIIERDAFMITHLNKLSPPRIDLEHLSEQDEDIKKILKRFQRCRLKVTLLQIPTDFPVFVTMALITDRLNSSPALAVGTSADFDIKKCLLDALAESLSIRLALRKEPPLFKKSFDSKIINRESRLFYWSKPENLSKINFLFKGAPKKIDLPAETKFFNLSTKEKNENLKIYYSEKLRDLKSALRYLNYDGCYVELTPEEVQKTGLHCTVTVIPELQPMHLDEKIPYFSGRRLKEVPTKLDYQPIQKVNTDPHPFP